MNINQRIAALATKFRSKNTTMNGLEVMENYRALFPVTMEPMTISFVAMYKDLVLLATGAPAAPIRTAWRA